MSINTLSASILQQSHERAIRNTFGTQAFFESVQLMYIPFVYQNHFYPNIMLYIRTLPLYVQTLILNSRNITPMIGTNIYEWKIILSEFFFLLDGSFPPGYPNVDGSRFTI